MIAAGHGSPTLMSAINERESMIRAITDQLIEPGSGPLQEELDSLRSLAVSRLTNLRTFLEGDCTVDEARALLAERFGKITLERVSESGKAIYRAVGEIDLFGDQVSTRVGGAGGPVCTVRATKFSLPIAA